MNSKTYYRKRLKHEKGYGLVPINGEIAKTFSLSCQATWSASWDYKNQINSKHLLYSFNKRGKYVSFDENADGMVKKHTNKSMTVNIWI